eukprot:901058-Amphidinium_carterae.3
MDLLRNLCFKQGSILTLLELGLWLLLSLCTVAVLFVPLNLLKKDRDAASSSNRSSGLTTSRPVVISQPLPTLVDTPSGDGDQSLDRDKRKEDTLVLTLDACPKRPKKSGTSQPRWAHRSKTPLEIDTIVGELRLLNCLPDRQGKHVVMLCADGIPNHTCVDSEPLFAATPKGGIQLKMHVLGLALCCPRCGVVSPLNERVQFSSRQCKIVKSVVPVYDVSKMADDFRLVLAHELSRGSTFSDTHLAALRDLTYQCQQVLEGSGSSSLSHSGGQLSIASFNVGGLRQKLEGVIDLNFDLVAIQEVGAARVHTESLRRLASKQNWQLSFGPTPISYRDAMGRKRTNPSLGVATLTRCTNGLSNMDHDFEPLPTRDLGPRLSSWFFIQGHFECYIHVIYGSTCAEEDWATSNMDLIAALRSRISQKKGIPQTL